MKSAGYSSMEETGDILGDTNIYCWLLTVIRGRFSVAKSGSLSSKVMAGEILGDRVSGIISSLSLAGVDFLDSIRVAVQYSSTNYCSIALPSISLASSFLRSICCLSPLTCDASFFI